MIYIGIDTGVHTGFAMIAGPERIAETLPIHSALDRVKELSNGVDPIHVRVEDARLRKWFGRNSNAKSQGAGSIKRDAKIWNDFLTELAADTLGLVTFQMVHPIKGATKMNSEIFKQITGIETRTSEHARDAFMLIHNFKIQAQ